MIIAALGRMGRGPERTLMEDYLKRCRGVVREIEVVAQERESVAQQSARLMAALPVPAVVVLMDETGEMLDSPRFAHRVQGLRERGQGPVAFCIGGADGHGEPARSKAVASLALGRLTFPHMLARVVLAEQLYRALTILDGHPYHRG